MQKQATAIGCEIEAALARLKSLAEIRCGAFRFRSLDLAGVRVAGTARPVDESALINDSRRCAGMECTRHDAGGTLDPRHAEPSRCGDGLRTSRGHAMRAGRGRLL